jgi:hypothetical protein
VDESTSDEDPATDNEMGLEPDAGGDGQDDQLPDLDVPAGPATVLATPAAVRPAAIVQYNMTKLMYLFFSILILKEQIHSQNHIMFILYICAVFCAVLRHNLRNYDFFVGFPTVRNYRRILSSVRNVGFPTRLYLGNRK